MAHPRGRQSEGASERQWRATWKEHRPSSRWGQKRGPEWRSEAGGHKKQQTRVAVAKGVRRPRFELGISQPQCEVLTTILHPPGEAGYRSQYLAHAKRALYHLSYIPMSPSDRPPLQHKVDHLQQTNTNTIDATPHTPTTQPQPWLPFHCSLQPLRHLQHP